MKALSVIKARWHDTSPREQRMLIGAMALVALALLWWVGVAPALSTLRAVEQQRPVLEAQLQHMQRLQAQAQALQAQPPVAPAEARRLLEASVKSLGATAQVSVVGDRATVTFKGASADALAQWLAQVRLTARAVPGEARLTRSAPGTWDGTVVLNLK